MFAAVPVWAVEEALTDHRDSCQVCTTSHPCLLHTALLGSLEDGRLPEEPTHVGDILPEVLDEILVRQRLRLHRELNKHADEHIFPEQRRDEPA